MQSRKHYYSAMVNDGLKKDDEDDFDVPMGCYDGAELCELIGTYLLNQVKVVIAK